MNWVAQMIHRDWKGTAGDESTMLIDHVAGMVDALLPALRQSGDTQRMMLELFVVRRHMLVTNPSSVDLCLRQPVTISIMSGEQCLLEIKIKPFAVKSSSSRCKTTIEAEWRANTHALRALWSYPVDTARREELHTVLAGELSVKVDCGMPWWPTFRFYGWSLVQQALKTQCAWFGMGMDMDSPTPCSQPIGHQLAETNPLPDMIRLWWQELREARGVDVELLRRRPSLNQARSSEGTPQKHPAILHLLITTHRQRLISV